MCLTVTILNLKKNLTIVLQNQKKMSLISFHPTTPSKRQQRQVVLNHPQKSSGFKACFKFKNSRRYSLLGRRTIHGLKFFAKSLLHTFMPFRPTQFNFCVTGYGYSKLPMREFVYAKTLFNQLAIFINNPLFYPGFTLRTAAATVLRKQLAGQVIFLSSVPLNFQISLVFNLNNQKPTFAKSSGTFATKRKLDKKTKLYIIILPSTKQILLPRHTLCTFAPNINLLLQKRVAGKWGLPFSFKKVINVRGVAQNPVDHPNGGRTKAKQPELSPWG